MLLFFNYNFFSFLSSLACYYLALCFAVLIWYINIINYDDNNDTNHTNHTNHTIKSVTVTNVKMDKAIRYYNVQFSENMVTGDYSSETKAGKTIEISGSSYKVEY